MTRVMRCPSCESEDVVEIERIVSFMGLTIDDKGEIIDTGNMEFDYDDARPLGMWCRDCSHEQMYKSGSLKEIRETRLRWSKTNTDSQ